MVAASAFPGLCRAVGAPGLLPHRRQVRHRAPIAQQGAALFEVAEAVGDRRRAVEPDVIGELPDRRAIASLIGGRSCRGEALGRVPEPEWQGLRVGQRSPKASVETGMAMFQGGGSDGPAADEGCTELFYERWDVLSLRACHRHAGRIASPTRGRDLELSGLSQGSSVLSRLLFFDDADGVRRVHAVTFAGPVRWGPGVLRRRGACSARPLRRIFPGASGRRRPTRRGRCLRLSGRRLR